MIIGPIAPDTLYDTWGMLTSGLVDVETVLRVMMLGPVYEQVVIKRERAVDALSFIDARPLSHEEIAAFGNTVKAEEAAFQEAFANIVAGRIDDE